MKNQVIKCLTPEHGKKIIQYWKDKGINTDNYDGYASEKGGFNCIYYGVIDGMFSSYPLKKVKENNAEIIELPEDITNMKEGKEIIGYKLKQECKKYEQAAINICNAHEKCISNLNNDDCGCAIGVFSEIETWLTEAGVFDLWFEPVYKIKHTLPTINGHEGELDGMYVKYGCASMCIEVLRNIFANKKISGNRNISSITLSSGVTITMDEIEQIIKYVDAQ